MTDVFPIEKRSWIMSRVKGRDTKPEVLVRSFVHRMGYRFRVHRRELPGNPDIVLASAQKGNLRTWVFLARPQGMPSIKASDNERKLLEQ